VLSVLSESTPPAQGKPVHCALRDTALMRKDCLRVLFVLMGTEQMLETATTRVDCAIRPHTPFLERIVLCAPTRTWFLHLDLLPARLVRLAGMCAPVALLLAGLPALSVLMDYTPLPQERCVPDVLWGFTMLIWAPLSAMLALPRSTQVYKQQYVPNAGLDSTILAFLLGVSIVPRDTLERKLHLRFVLPVQLGTTMIRSARSLPVELVRIITTH